MTSPQAINPSNSFFKRFLFWASDRFPIFNIIVAFVMAFSIKGLFSRELGFEWAFQDFLLGLLFLTLLFILRVMDEHKDFESDKTFHPDRAVQKGIIQLFELRRLGYLALALQSVALFYLSQSGLLILGIWAFVLTWALLMLKEFFVKNWLRQRLLFYSFLHLLISPFMFLTGWYYYASQNNSFDLKKLMLLMSLSLVTGLMFEIGRKNRSAPEDAKGEISFSQIWGRKKTCLILIILSIISLILGSLYIGSGIVSLIVFAIFGLLLLFLAVHSLINFIKSPSEENHKKSRQLIELLVVWSFVGSFLIVLVRSYL
ncbi:MAG: hypothetical protein ACK5V3_03255 [Bdellovibrionales bacterium]